MNWYQKTSQVSMVEPGLLDQLSRAALQYDDVYEYIQDFMDVDLPGGSGIRELGEIWKKSRINIGQEGQVGYV